MSKEDEADHLAERLLALVDGKGCTLLLVPVEQLQRELGRLNKNTIARMHDMASVLEGAEAVKQLDTITAADPELAHAAAEKVLLWLVPSEVRLAYERLAKRCRWWATG